jgi:hypothetical protein
MSRGLRVSTVALFAAATGVMVSAQRNGVAPPPEAPAVVQIYGDILTELRAEMAAGGRETPKMRELEERLAAEVRRAGPVVIDAVRRGDQKTADAAAYALKYAANPEAAVTALVASLDRFDGALVNNAGLSLEALAMSNPRLLIPMAPLVVQLRTQEWNRQQKIAQLLQVLAEQGRVTDEGGRLSAALIPMLASQRVRVFASARYILATVTGQNLGNAPEPWIAWHTRRYRSRIDLAAGIYELVQIVRPEMVGSEERYRMEREIFTTRPALLTALQRDAESARVMGRRLGVVIQVPDSGFPQERLSNLTTAVHDRMPTASIVISPSTDEFVPFTTAAGNLRRLLQR